jgi:flagella basal body P-ring formation protein FlgA
LVKVDDKFIKRLRVNANVAVYQDVVKTINSLQRGNIIGTSDVVIERTRTERLLRDIPTSLDKVIGKAATRNIQNGKIVKFRDLKKVPTVKRGARVIILARRGTMKITAPGTVREDGFKNSIVQVVNLETKKTIYAEVINGNTVEVRF